MFFAKIGVFKSAEVVLLWLNLLISRHFGYSSCMGQSSSTNMARPATPFVLSPKARHTATVIFLHGLGDNGAGWCEAFRGIRLDHIKYIFPNAPSMPVSLNGGMCMPSWFNLYTLSLEGKEDEEGIQKASSNLVSMIDKEEQSGIPKERIMIGGFSQGGAVALHAGLVSGKKIAGVIALSSWLPSHKKVMSLVKTPPEFPILQCHGQSDPVVPFQYGAMTFELIKQKIGCSQIQFNKYPGLGHSSDDKEMDAVKNFLTLHLPSSDS